MAEIGFAEFERLLKMIEEKFGMFGKVIGVLLLMLATLALFGWLIHLVVDFVVLPTDRLVALIITKPHDVLSILYELALVAGNVIIAFVFIPWSLLSLLKIRQSEIRFAEREKRYKKRMELLEALPSAVDEFCSELESGLAEQKNEKLRGAISKFTTKLRGLCSDLHSELEKATCPRPEKAK